MSDLEEALNHIRVMAKANARWRRIARSTISDLHAENMTLRSENSRLRTHWVLKYLESNDAADMLDELDAALNTIDKVREAVSGHPECDQYADEDAITCGWKNAYASVVRALGSVPPTNNKEEPN